MFQRIGVKTVSGERQHSDFIVLIHIQNGFSRVIGILHCVCHVQGWAYTCCRSILMLLSISVQVMFLFSDVNECSYAEFNACPKKNTCVNLEGYYICAPQHAHADIMQHQLSQRKEGKKHSISPWKILRMPLQDSVIYCRSHLHGKGFWSVQCSSFCSWEKILDKPAVSYF